MKTLYWLLSVSPSQNFFIAQKNLCGRKLFFSFLNVLHTKNKWLTERFFGEPKRVLLWLHCGKPSGTFIFKSVVLKITFFLICNNQKNLFSTHKTFVYDGKVPWMLKVLHGTAGFVLFVL